MSEDSNEFADENVDDNMETATFEEFEQPYYDDKSVETPVDEINMDVILDVPVTIAMEIGRAQINIRNLLQLNQGSVVELDRFAGEPLDVLVNGTLIAHGEVVVVNDKFGIRLTEVISPSERVKRLS
ncbi:MAG: flagellar motor switch protein FliN [Methylovulum sp.]|nr:flagellar motor switch protein FliN [Methylovulum sp.]